MLVDIPAVYILTPWHRAPPQPIAVRCLLAQCEAPTRKNTYSDFLWLACDDRHCTWWSLAPSASACLSGHSASVPLMLAAGADGGQDDYVGAATTVFREVAMAVEENEGFLQVHPPPRPRRLDPLCGGRDRPATTACTVLPNVLERHVHVRTHWNVFASCTLKQSSKRPLRPYVQRLSVQNFQSKNI